jgi:hypothetical protein
VLTRAAATRPKRHPTTQHRCSGTEVCRPPPPPWGTRPPPLTPCVQGKPPRRAEARDAEVVERPGSDPPNATTTRHDDGDGDRTAPRAPPHTTVHLAQRPWHCAQAHDGDRQTTPCRDPPTTTMTRHRHHTRHWDAPPAPPLTLSTEPKGSGVVHKRATSIANHRRVATHQRPRRCATTTTTTSRGRLEHTTLPPSTRDSPSVVQKRATSTRPGHATTVKTRRRHGKDDQATPNAPPTSTIHRAAKPRRRAQARDVDRARRQTDDDDDGAQRDDDGARHSNSDDDDGAARR